MDKFQAAFDVLYFLAAIDGKLSKNELDVILDFLQSNHGHINFDPGDVMQSIDMLTTTGMIDELRRAALVIKDTTTAKDRRILLDFAFELIAADGKITESESELFWLLGNTWDVNIKAYLKSK